MSCSNRIVSEIVKILLGNLLQDECEIPKKYAPTYTNKVKYNFNKNN